MHDIKDIRKNIEKYKKKFQERNLNFDTSEFNKIDNANRDLIIKKETLEQEKKLLSKSKEKKNSCNFNERTRWYYWCRTY